MVRYDGAYGLRWLRVCVKHCVGWGVFGEGEPEWIVVRLTLCDVMHRVQLVAGRVGTHVALRERSSRQLLRPCGRHVRAVTWACHSCETLRHPLARAAVACEGPMREGRYRCLGGFDGRLNASSSTLLNSGLARLVWLNNIPSTYVPT